MINEEAIRMLKAKLACLSMDTSGCYSECNEELCDECPLNYEQGNMGEQKEYIRMSIEALEQQPCKDAISRQAVLDHIYGINGLEGFELSNVFEKHYADFIKSLPSVTPQQKMGHCKDCKYFAYDVVNMNKIPWIVAHEMCLMWGDGCKTKEDGYCFLFEPRAESEGK